MTTPFLNVEKVTLPFSQNECLVYDMSGQVSTIVKKSWKLIKFVFRDDTAKVGASSIRTWMEFSLSSMPATLNACQWPRKYSKRWLGIQVSTAVIPFHQSSCRIRWISPIRGRNQLTKSNYVRSSKSNALRPSTNRCVSTSRRPPESSTPKSTSAFRFLKANNDFTSI